jgi:hypothetical protein
MMRLDSSHSTNLLTWTVAIAGTYLIHLDVGYFFGP